MTADNVVVLLVCWLYACNDVELIFSSAAGNACACDSVDVDRTVEDLSNIDFMRGLLMIDYSYCKWLSSSNMYSEL